MHASFSPGMKQEPWQNILRPHRTAEAPSSYGSTTENSASDTAHKGRRSKDLRYTKNLTANPQSAATKNLSTGA